MARPNPGTVPNDMWICGNCEGGYNLIKLTDGRCPTCGHQRDSCCTGPGEPYPQTTGLFPGYPGYSSAPSDLGICSEYGAENCDWVDLSPLCNIGTRSTGSDYTSAIAFDSYGGAGSPATGSWECGECGSANSDLTPDFCPACGASR